MANSVSHASLPYPIKNARYTIFVPFLDADGDPTDPTTPDTEISQDGGAYADAAEEVTTITGSNGSGYITLTGAETNNSVVGVAFKIASGPKATLAALYPRNLPILESGTAGAGAAGSITLASGTYTGLNLTGCFVRTTGGTGGGGTGGANNQARRITAYNTSTRVATVTPNWETTPDATTTYDILLPEGVLVPMLTALPPTTLGRTLAIESDGMAHADVKEVAGTTQTAGDIIGDTNDIQSRLPSALVGGRIDANVGAISADATAADNAEAFFDGTGYAGTNNVIPTVTTVTNAVSANVTQISGDAVAADNLEAALDGTGGVTITAGLTGNVTGNLSGSVGSLATQAKADVNAEVVDALATDTYAEPGQGAPASTTTLAAKINYLYKSWRNKKTQTSDTWKLFADDTTTVDQKATVSDDGTTATKGEIATGP